MERYLAQAGATLVTLLLAAPLAGQTFERRLRLADLREVSSITALEISGAAEDGSRHRHNRVESW